MDDSGVQEAISLLNKLVEISLHGEKDNLTGRIYTIDPVSQNVVLITNGSGEKQLRLIMKHAIKSITITGSDALEVADVHDISSEAFEDNQNRANINEITEWLQSNRLQFEVIDERIEVEGVSISPPYRPDDCLGSNMIVLARVQKLLSDRPKSTTKPPG